MSLDALALLLAAALLLAWLWRRRVRPVDDKPKRRRPLD